MNRERFRHHDNFFFDVVDIPCPKITISKQYSSNIAITRNVKQVPESGRMIRLSTCGIGGSDRRGLASTGGIKLSMRGRNCGEVEREGLWKSTRLTLISRGELNIETQRGSQHLPERQQ